MALAFDRNFNPPYGVAEKVSPLVTRVVCANPGPFTFTGTATFIVGVRELAVIDPGPDDDAHLEALLAAIGKRPVSHILITHTHRDHSPLAARLKALTGAVTAGFGPHAARRAAGLELDASGDDAFSPDLRLEHGQSIAGADVSIEAVHTPGHTSNHMAFALKEEQALFCGDHVMAWSTTVVAPPDGDMGQYLKSLELLLGRRDEIYWPTHGPPRRDPHPLVRGLIAHRRMREGAILARLRQGPLRLDALVAAIYVDVDPRLHGAAALSTLAHLRLLVEEGRVAEEARGEGLLYRLA